MACRTPQEIAESYLTVPVEVVDRTLASDGAGGWTTTEETAATVKGRVSGYGGPVTAEVAERLRGRTAYRFRLPVTTPVKVGSLLRVGERAFEVVGVSNAPGATLAEVIAAEAE